jgi:hypothetical protein
MNLKNLIVDTKVVSVDFPGLDGFSVDIAYLSRATLIKLRAKCVTTKFNRKTRQPEEDFNLEMFNDLFVAEAIKGWKGLKLKYLESFLVVDLGGQDLETELEYNAENAQLLLKSSSDFDSWLTEVLNDLDTFRGRPAGSAV